MHISRRTTALALALLVTVVAAVTAQEGHDGPPGIEVTRLAQDIYLMRAPQALDKWTSSNSVVIVGETGVVIFDTNALSSTSELVLDEIRAITDLPVRVIVNSHWHMDHWSGNEVYADAFPGLQIISTFETKSFMERMPRPFFMRSAGVQQAQQSLDNALETGKLASGDPALRDAEGNSLMRRYNDVMTVQQLVDLVTFLQGTYEVYVPQTQFPTYP